MVTQSPASGSGRGSKIDKQRRKVVKLLTATGAAAITSPWVFQSSRAAPRTIKIGMVSSGDRTDRRVRRSRSMGGRRSQQGPGAGHHEVAGEKHPVEILNRDSQSNPNRASEVAAQLINSDRVDIMIASSTGGHDQSGGRPVRTQWRALHHRRRSVGGLVLWPQRQPGEGLRVDLPLLLGLRHGRRHVRRHVAVACRPTRRSASCSPTTRTASRPAIRSTGCRPPSRATVSMCTSSASIRR